jgi:hypothetical protein
MQMKTAESAMPLKLSRGRHADPSEGACLMELASLLAGEPWSDHPVCVHPVLAAVARGVNDKIGDDERARLAPLVPYMIGTATKDPRRSARLVLLCARVALARPDIRDHVDICCQMEAARRLATGVLSVTRQCSDQPVSSRLRMITIAALAYWRLLQPFYLRQAAFHAALAVATVAGTEASDRVALCELLESCVACSRTSSGYGEAAGPTSGCVTSARRWAGVRRGARRTSDLFEPIA